MEEVSKQNRRTRLPEDYADASKHVGVVTIYKYCLYIYICLHSLVCIITVQNAR